MKKKIRDLQKIEFLEKKFFDYIKTFLKKNLKPILEGFNSRHKIFNDWNSQFLATARANYDASNLNTGAERILYHVFSLIKWIPNSCPISSDLFFELPDAFIHIDIKSALISNKSDYHGAINIGRNQTTYPAHKGSKSKGKPIIFYPNLPRFYNEKKPNRKICLTYVIHIIHENKKENTIAILFASIPNGELFKVYGNKIVRRGKSAYCKKCEVKDFRYNYYKEPRFLLLTETPLRIEFIHFDNSQKPSIEKESIVRFELNKFKNLK